MNVENEIQVYQNAVIAFTKVELIDKSIETYAKLILSICDFKKENPNPLALADALSESLLVTRELCFLMDNNFHLMPHGYHQEDMIESKIPSIFQSIISKASCMTMYHNTDFQRGDDVILSLLNNLDYEICKAGYLVCRTEFEHTFSFYIKQLLFTSELTGMV